MHPAEQLRRRKKDFGGQNMNNSKTTKRSLTASILSIFLCLMLLLGATCAWFTDSVTSGNNRIVAGNLDVALYMVDGQQETPVTDTTDMFQNSGLWEPGHVDVDNLNIANEGSLALQYQLSVNVASEKSSINVNGDTFRLSDYLNLAIVDGNNTYATRDEALAAATGAGSDIISSADAGRTGTLYPSGGEHASEQYVTMIVYMPQNTGNEANYDREYDAPEINLGVKLVATQAQHESDSFGDTYDADAKVTVTDATALKEAINNGGIVSLGDDIKIAPQGSGDGLVSQTTVTSDTYLDLSNRTLGVDKGSITGTLPYTPALIAVSGATMTIDGDGVIDAEAGYNNSFGINIINGGKLIINGGTYYGAMSAVQVQTGLLEINGGFFDLASTIKQDAPEMAQYLINCIDANYKNGTAKVVIKGGTFVNFNPADNRSEGEGTNYVADGYKVVSETQVNGEIWYTVVPE